MKKVIILALAILMLSFGSAATYGNYLEYNWNLADNLSRIEQDIIYSDSVLIEIKTPPAECSIRTATSQLEFNSHDKFDTLHSIDLSFPDSKSEGTHAYFIKCKDKNTGTASNFNLTFTTKLKIYSSIEFPDDENNILDEGQHKIKLTTSEIPKEGTVELFYTYDGVSFSPIVLQGSGINYYGYITIPKSEGEKSGSFKFSAQSINRQPGTKIISGGTFQVDTKAPYAITAFEAIGEYKKIKLEWFTDDEDLDEINIYRSTSPGVGVSDFYKTVDSDDDYYTDTSVTKGKTYYYRISPVDKAGNKADLSIEVSAAMRTDNSETPSIGLNANLLSIVDSMLTEIDLLQDDISSIQKSISSYNEQDKESIKSIGISKTIDSASSELSSLEKTVVAYKAQDLSEELLNSRIDAARIKLEIIKRKIPDTISKTDSESKNIPLSEDNIRELLLEYLPELSPSQIDKTIKKSLKLMNENNMAITSEIDIFEITYLDGSIETKSLIKHKLSSTLEKSPENIIILKIPISIDSDDIEMKGSLYQEEKENLISFDTDTKSISYVVDSEVDPKILDDILLSAIQGANPQTTITGNVVGISGASVVGIVLLVIFAGGLITYLMLMKKKSGEKDHVESFLIKAQEVKDLQKSNDHEKAGKLYESLKSDYLSLSKDEKSKVFNKVKQLHKK